jgi:S-adenosylmethionine synthetase
MSGYSVTSESVTEGHPDKLCDQISDAVLDAYLDADRDSRVAVETMASCGCLVVAGEVSSEGTADIGKIARKVAEEVGYGSEEAGLDCRNCLVLTNVRTQSPDIALGVARDGMPSGAGDQGIMYGYACDETDVYMPLPIYLAHRLAKRLAELRGDKGLKWLRPDGKTQVTVLYDENGRPERVQSVVVSAQHDEGVGIEELRWSILEMAVFPVLGGGLLREDTRIHINPTGRFVLGGPAADAGLTGRKIMVDTYGGVCRHGGGAFSGKDPTKVDRSAAYMARFAAKNIVAGGLARKCEVSLAYAIGLPRPEAVMVNTFGTGVMPDGKLAAAAEKNFDFSVDGIIDTLSLKDIRYLRTAAYGHFGRAEENFPWEKLADIKVP